MENVWIFTSFKMLPKAKCFQRMEGKEKEWIVSEQDYSQRDMD